MQNNEREREREREKEWLLQKLGVNLKAVLNERFITIILKDYRIYTSLSATV